MSKQLSGTITALITPFRNYKLDLKAFESIIECQIYDGVDGVVVGGSTGEGATLSNDEYKELLKVAMSIAEDKIFVIGGKSSNSTKAAIELAQIGDELGIDCNMCAVPYYNKPSQEGLFKHFKAIHNHTSTPIMLYSVPSRSAVDFDNDCIVALSEFNNIIALKDASGDLRRPFIISSKIESNDFSLLCGDDILSVAYNAHGGCGCVSVTSNLIPDEVVKLQALCLGKEYDNALRQHLRMEFIYHMLSVETNPVPIKYAMSLLGKCSPEVRLPLCSLSESSKAEIKSCALFHSG